MSNSQRDSVSRDAYAVLLPAFDSAEFTDESHAFFSRGGVATLLGCSRKEYVDRRMSQERQDYETPKLFRDYTANAKALAGDVLIAVDYEIGGVHRLHRLAPQLTHPSQALSMSVEAVEQFGHECGVAALKLGVNFFLSPVVDVVTGPNPWLRDRTLSSDPWRVASIAGAFIRGVQDTGVAATAKHFPGHHTVVIDPYDSSEVVVPGTLDEIAAGFVPFHAAIEQGVKAIMTGPVPVTAIDDVEPSSSSALIVEKLRAEFGFSGLIVSDDLDLPGTLRGRTIADVAVLSLLAGVELLLLASGPQVAEVAQRIVTAVESGELPRQTLETAAAKIRALAETSAQATKSS
jgi:beta-N-acetylhexosaminidase